MSNWLDWGEITISLGWIAKASRLRMFPWLSYRGLLRAHHDFGSWLCSSALLTGVCQFSWCERFNDRAGSGLEISWGSSPNNTPPRTWFQPRPRLSCLADGSARFAFGLEGWVHHPFAAFNKRLPSKCHLGLLPLHTAPLLGCVVSFTAAALKVEHSPGKGVSPQVTHRGAYLQ